MPVAVVNGRSVLYVHIPKTGGSSVERYLSRHGSVFLKGNGRVAGMRCSAQHLHAAALASIDAAEGHDWCFTIVRHPVVRLVSEYRYQMRKPGWLRSRLSFSGWLSYALSRRGLDPWYRDNHFRPQHEFVLPGMEIMRFEDGVDACLRRIGDRLGTPPPATPIREKPSPRVPLILTERALGRIREAYARDFADFGYGEDVPSLLAAGLQPDMLAGRQR
ncbi:sulfotransferase family 2 domain-containing protein [Aquibium microcysteis]|uniref:sulfotransferase family 2 domain-containing protein n=1 Tax=Aquibium microcysteis TaxID=675281 RepID=UPI00165D2802|nr:sulfotransferase family 2 domain-containing protein [Aquibium microcysteis]